MTQDEARKLTRIMLFAHDECPDCAGELLAMAAVNFPEVDWRTEIAHFDGDFGTESVMAAFEAELAAIEKRIAERKAIAVAERKFHEQG